MKVVCDGKELEVFGTASQEVYSTEETRIGTLIDKPFYRKIYTFEYASVSENNTVADVSALNIDALIDIYGSIKKSDNRGVYPLNCPYIGTSCWISPSNELKIHVENLSGFDVNGYVVVEYTKTTD